MSVIYIYILSPRHMQHMLNFLFVWLANMNMLIYSAHADFKTGLAPPSHSPPIELEELRLKFVIPAFDQKLRCSILWLRWGEVQDNPN